ncbi:MAG: tRNA pseudouridine(55) synthase TruB [Candidatus Zixiibacteriota bacterium]|jgi:tRNA pseudouridine55 synthase
MVKIETGGLINVDKSRGPTSHDVVDMARRALGTKKVGHAGTLDPAAHGVLPLLFGRVTRLARFFLGYDKTYRFVAKLGAETSTGDDEGEVLYKRKVTPAVYEALPAVARSFVGEIMQEVPKFSAVKHDGEPLYKKARRGEAVTAPTRVVTIKRLEIEEAEDPTFTAYVECGGGTYIRALARDIGRKLGVGAYVVDLTRLAVGPFRIEDAVPQVEVEAGDIETILRPPHFIPADGLLPDLPSVTLTAGEGRDVVHGRPVTSRDAFPADTAVRLVTAEGRLLGIGLAAGDLIKPDTVIVKPEELGG